MTGDEDPKIDNLRGDIFGGLTAGVVALSLALGFGLAILVALGSYASRIPMAVLAGILITVGIGIIDYRGLKHLCRVPQADSAVMLAVLLLTVLVDLLQAVAAGMIMASLFFYQAHERHHREKGPASADPGARRRVVWTSGGFPC
ncbi:MAG: hypothetical protein J5I81_07420 [Nitrococcus mobilis]|nr:hypothetical protein [Nitrococcus mobilis]